MDPKYQKLRNAIYAVLFAVGTLLITLNAATEVQIEEWLVIAASILDTIMLGAAAWYTRKSVTVVKKEELSS
jgi:hypothetical protein